MLASCFSIVFSSMLSIAYQLAMSLILLHITRFLNFNWLITFTLSQASPSISTRIDSCSVTVKKDVSFSHSER